MFRLFLARFKTGVFGSASEGLAVNQGPNKCLFRSCEIDCSSKTMPFSVLLTVAGRSFSYGHRSISVVILRTRLMFREILLHGLQAVFNSLLSK